MTTEGTPDQAALRAASTPTRIASITLENGIVLRLKPVPPYALQNASKHIKRPAIPVWTDPDKGREEPNPFDPEYLAALDQWRQDVSMAGMTVALLLGTEVEFIPADCVGPDADSWIDDLEAVNALAGGEVTIHREGRARYLDWVRMYAIPSSTDIFRLTRILTAGVGLSEQEVADAAESFRRGVAGIADPIVSVAEPTV